MFLDDPAPWWSRESDRRQGLRVLLCGTWDFTGPNPVGENPGGGNLNLSTGSALTEIAAGFLTVCPDADITQVPFGGGATFQASLSDKPVWAFSQGRRESSSAGVARELLEALEKLEQGKDASPDLGLLEGSHGWGMDLGLGFVRMLSGDYELTWASSGSQIHDALAAVNEKIDGLPLLYLSSTGRQMLGAGSIADVDPLMQAHTPLYWQDLAKQIGLPEAENPQAAAEHWGQQLAEYAAERPEDYFPEEFARIPSPSTDPRYRRGGGGGGGNAGLLSALGVAICDTGEVLYQLAGMTQHLRNKDLVIVVEPYVDAGCLMESTLPVVSAAALRWGIPVVAATARATIGAHELSSWHLHGVSQLKRGRDLADLGRRLGQTWGTL